ncbi:hypothetical protein RRG08_029854 [Elysia crispata]|uniref:Uncharacterized protein n=1 Tax=Elysia crispata TaxID=231223 RepID=A0AAE0YKH8_9GAST|nr:hypothetical protein RRG08_029854 [Elysia crispata]
MASHRRQRLLHVDLSPPLVSRGLNLTALMPTWAHKGRAREDSTCRLLRKFGPSGFDKLSILTVEALVKPFTYTTQKLTSFESAATLSFPHGGCSTTARGRSLAGKRSGHAFTATHTCRLVPGARACNLSEDVHLE